MRRIFGISNGLMAAIRLAADRRHHFVDVSGIVVVPRGGRREFLLGLEEFSQRSGVPASLIQAVERVEV